MAKFLIDKIYRKILHAVYLQILLSFVYLPILIAWGLPISWVCLFSNLLLTPWLATFLFLATLLILCDACCIPHAWLCRLFDHFSTWWLTVMHWSKPEWLTGFERPQFWLLIVTVAIGLALAITLKKYLVEWRIIASLCVLSTLLQSYQYARQEPAAIVTYRTNPVTIRKQTDGLLVTISPGNSRTTYFMRWYFRTLRPYLYRQFGTATIKQLILRYPTQSLANEIFQQRLRLNYQQLSVVRNNRKTLCSQIIAPTSDAPAFCTVQPAAGRTH